MADANNLRQWAAELDRLMQRAIAARQSGDVAQVVAVQRALRKFKEESPDYADALDTQATLAIFDLDLQETEQAVKNIKERAAEVYRLTKLIAGIGEEAKKDADVLSGKLAIQAIDAATSAISAFKGLRQELSNSKPDEKKIATEIDKLVEAIQGLRNKLEAA